MPSGLGSWFANAPGGWSDPTDSGRFASGGSSYGVPAISFLNRGTLGQWFNVTAPNGNVLTLQQLDIGPSAWTGKTIDITGAAGSQFGYTPNNFPTGSTFSWDGPFATQADAQSALNGGPIGNDIWSTGTSAVPFSGNSDPTGIAGNGSGAGIGYLGETSTLGSAYSFGNSGYVQSDQNGNFVSLPNQSTDVSTTAGYGGNSFNTGAFPSSGDTAAQTIGASDPTAAGIGDAVTGSNSNVGGLNDALTGGTGSSDVPGGISNIGGGAGGILGMLGGLGGLFGGGGSQSGATFFAWLGDWAIRGAVILLGFIFIVAGLFLLKGNLVLAPEAGVLKEALK